MELREKQLIALLKLINVCYCVPEGDIGHIFCEDCYICSKCDVIPVGDPYYLRIEQAKEAIKDFNQAEVLTVLLKYGDVI